MNKKIKIRFEMYEVGCIQGQDNSLFRLEELCESIDRMDLHDRYDDYFGDKVRLDYCQVDSINNQLYKLHFTRLRDDKISKTSIASLELANIDLEEGEYIAEDVSAIYDTEKHTLVLQRNVHSLSVTGIQYYLNKMLNRIVEGNKKNIKFSAICDSNILSKIKLKKEFRKLELSIKIPEDDTYDNNSFLGPFVGKAKERNVATLMISLSAGRQKEGLDLMQTIDDLPISENNSYLTAVNVYAKENEAASIEKFDLLHGKKYFYINLDIQEGGTYNYMTLLTELMHVYKKKFLEER